MANVEEALNAAWIEAQEWRLHPRAVRLHAWATAVLAYYGFMEPGRPDIISGYRSPEEQRKLLRRWESGDREGLAARPAKRSWHMHEGPNGEPAALAWDVEDHVNGYSMYEQQLRRIRNIKVGADFGDTGHFALPIGNLPPSIASDGSLFAQFNPF
jgi:hypothetical protein